MSALEGGDGLLMFSLEGVVECGSLLVSALEGVIEACRLLVSALEGPMEGGVQMLTLEGPALSLLFSTSSGTNTNPVVSTRLTF